jgi:hypothetical protein
MYLIVKLFQKAIYSNFLTKVASHFQLRNGFNLAKKRFYKIITTLVLVAGGDLHPILRIAFFFPATTKIQRKTGRNVDEYMNIS